MSDVIPVAEPCLGESEERNLVKAIREGWISSKGDFILEFESRFAAYCGTKYAVATSNGTVALHLALKALGISEGDEVIVPTLTFIATANSVAYCNAKPVFVDSQADYWCMDPEAIERVVSPRTKAIMPVHLYGHPCDMDAIIQVAKRHGLYVVEDAAEAHGAEYKGRKVGSFGDINCFSFYGNKIITTGEGGMCLTDDRALADKMRILRDHGMNPGRKYWHDEVGFNYRMTNMQAAVGVAQMEKLESFVERKRGIARAYNAFLEGAPGIILPPEEAWAKSVYWMYSILLGDPFGADRDTLAVELRAAGIDSRPLFHPLHTMPPYSCGIRFPVAEDLSRRGINLPCGVGLKDDDVRKVAKAILSVAAGARH